MRETVAEFIVEVMVQSGVEVVFGMPGSHVNALYPFLAAGSIRHVSVKHEGNGAVMADVYGRLTGKPGVLITTAGPGATNALSGIAAAYNAASPLVHICGSVERGGKTEGFHGGSSEDFLRRVFEPVTMWSFRLEELDQLPKALLRAFELATSQRPGPVHIEIPWDLLEAGPVETAVPPVGEERAQRDKSRSILTSMAGILEKASDPVICAGKGILAHRAREVLCQFVEKTGIPVVIPGNTPGIFPEDHPLFAGFVTEFMTHPFATPLAIDILKKADVLLAIGFGADNEELEIFHRYTEGRFLFVGFDSLDRLDPKSEVGIVENCRWALENLLTIVQGGRDSWDPNISEAMDAYRRRVDEGVESYRGSKPLYFGIALKELASLLEPDAICVTDVGNHWVLSRLLLPLYSRAEIVAPGTYQAMGFALPGAIGAKVAQPERRVVGITGDGCFLLSCSDFLTAVEEKLPLVLVVLSDGHYGVIHYLHRKRYGQSYAAKLGPVDYVKFVESCGGIGFRVKESSELRPAFKEAFSAQIPAVVEVVTGSDFPYTPLDKE